MMVMLKLLVAFRYKHYDLENKHTYSEQPSVVCRWKEVKWFNHWKNWNSSLQGFLLRNGPLIDKLKRWEIQHFSDWKCLFVQVVDLKRTVYTLNYWTWRLRKEISWLICRVGEGFLNYSSMIWMKDWWSDITTECIWLSELKKGGQYRSLGYCVSPGSF